MCFSVDGDRQHENHGRLRDIKSRFMMNLEPQRSGVCLWAQRQALASTERGHAQPLHRFLGHSVRQNKVKPNLKEPWVVVQQSQSTDDVNTQAAHYHNFMCASVRFGTNLTLAEYF